MSAFDFHQYIENKMLLPIRLNTGSIAGTTTSASGAHAYLFRRYTIIAALSIYQMIALRD